jgi:hypothetical protein
MVSFPSPSKVGAFYSLLIHIGIEQYFVFPIIGHELYGKSPCGEITKLPGFVKITIPETRWFFTGRRNKKSKHILTGNSCLSISCGLFLK